MSLASARAREQFASARSLQETLTTQYDVSMDLLRSHHGDATGLGWLSRTTALAGMLAMRGAETDPGALSIRNVYDPQGETTALVGQVIDEHHFPPAELLRRSASLPGTVVLIIRVSCVGSQEGLLAMVAPVDNRDASGRETFHQWAALLAVALDHQEVLHSLQQGQHDLRRSEQRYALAAAAANDGLWDWDLAMGTMYFSDRAHAVLGSDHALQTLQDWLRCVHLDDREGLRHMIGELRRGVTESVEFEHRAAGGDAEPRWVLCRGLAVLVDGVVVRIVGSLTDVTKRRELEDRLRRQAMYDSLTALPNRVLLLDRLEHAIHRARRHIHYRFAVLFIDLDGFKVINDSLGHVTGDKLLVAMATRLQSFVRAGDTAARLGGDEFVVLLDDLAPDADVSDITRRLQIELAAPFEIDGHAVVVTASIGITTTEQEHESAEDMLRDADIAMYRTKTNGRGGQAMFDTTMRVQLVTRMSIESELRAATERGAFELFYQPIVALQTGMVQSFEALIRWPHETRGVMPPGEFLPIAEETGLIVPLGRWVVEEACRQISS